MIEHSKVSHKSRESPLAGGIDPTIIIVVIVLILLLGGGGVWYFRGF
jgi:hypothetical protein